MSCAAPGCLTAGEARRLCPIRAQVLAGYRTAGHRRLPGLAGDGDQGRQRLSRKVNIHRPLPTSTRRITLPITGGHRIDLSDSCPRTSSLSGRVDRGPGTALDRWWRIRRICDAGHEPVAVPGIAGWLAGWLLAFWCGRTGEAAVVSRQAVTVDEPDAVIARMPPSSVGEWVSSRVGTSGPLDCVSWLG